MPTITSTQSRTESALRHLAKRRGFRVWKVRDDSRWYREFGPFSVVHIETNSVAARGLTLDDLAEWFDA